MLLQNHGIIFLTDNMAGGANNITVDDVDGVTMPRKDGYVRDTIGNEQEVRVIFVGEGNFTFSTAFASLRGGWSNIIASDISHIPPDYYNHTLLLTIRNCLKYNDELDAHSLEEAYDIYETTTQFIAKIVNLPRTRFLPYIDATRLRETELFNADPPHDAYRCAIFFQCPYVGYANDETKQLVRDFISSASEVQRPGDFLFIGITTMFPYCKNYGLPEVIGGGGHAQNNRYLFMGADTEFPKDMLRRGYKHQAFTEIHDKIKDSHITLCFTKQ